MADVWGSTLFLRSGMSGVVHRTQPLLADVSVQLGGRQIGVAQQLLYGPQVGATVEQVGGVGVAQRVGVGGRRGSPVQDAPDVPRREPPPPAVEEQGVRR